MDVLEAIATRKSVREYTPKLVDQELIKQVVDAGRQAPSGNNVQPCEFIVVTDSNMRKQIAEICRNGKFIADAPVCIVTFSKDTKYYLEDGCAAVENILLAATELGLGTCWVAGDKKPYGQTIRELLDVPPQFRLVALVAMGYEKGGEARKEKRSLNDVLHWEKYK